MFVDTLVKVAWRLSWNDWSKNHLVDFLHFLGFDNDENYCHNSLFINWDIKSAWINVSMNNLWPEELLHIGGPARDVRPASGADAWIQAQPGERCMDPSSTWRKMLGSKPNLEDLSSLPTRYEETLFCYVSWYLGSVRWSADIKRHKTSLSPFSRISKPSGIGY